MYCFFRELAELVDVPTFNRDDSSRHFLFLFTWRRETEDNGPMVRRDAETNQKHSSLTVTGL